MSIKWQDMIPDKEVPTRAGTPSIHTLLQKAQVRWAGHVTRMPDDRLPKQLLYGELCYGKRSVGGQKKRFNDTLKKTLTSFNINVANWEVCAQDRPLWRSMIHTDIKKGRDVYQSVKGTSMLSQSYKAAVPLHSLYYLVKILICEQGGELDV